MVLITTRKQFLALLIATSSVSVECFTTCRFSSRKMELSALKMSNNEPIVSHHDKLSNMARSLFLTGLVGATTFFNPSNALADEIRISECKVNENKACVSTASVKNLKYFTSPWEFSVSSEEALARIKGLLNDSPGVTIDKIETFGGSSSGVSEEGVATPTPSTYYVHAKAKGDYVFEGEGDIEFLINKPDNNIVTFKASGYGANKGFFDNLRKKSGGVFTSSSGMGQDMEDALLGVGEYSNSRGGDGILGQLKAFYGYQSGQGFEDVLLDED